MEAEITQSFCGVLGGVLVLAMDALGEVLERVDLAAPMLVLPQLLHALLLATARSLAAPLCLFFC